MLEKALSLTPGDSILLSNSTHVLKEAALRDVIGDDLDFDLLRSDPSLDSFRQLYVDDAGREEYVRRLRAHAGIGRVQEYLDRLQLLAPKEPNHYAAAAELALLLDDLDRVRALA